MAKKSDEQLAVERQFSDIVVSRLAIIIEEVTGIRPQEITPEKYFIDDLDIDSLSMVEIVVEVEDRYRVKIPDEDLAGMRTIGGVVEYVLTVAREYPDAARTLAERFGTPDELEIVNRVLAYS